MFFKFVILRTGGVYERSTRGGGKKNVAPKLWGSTMTHVLSVAFEPNVRTFYFLLVTRSYETIPHPKEKSDNKKK